MRKLLICLSCIAAFPSLSHADAVAVAPVPCAAPGCAIAPTAARSVARATSRPAVPQGVAASAAPVPAAQPLTIVQGDIKLLPVTGKVTRVALGSATVVSATSIDRNLLLIAEKVGETTLMVWAGGKLQHYRIQVVAKDPQQVRDKVEMLIAGLKGVTLQQLGPDLVLGGFAHKEVLGKLSTLLQDLPNVINNIREDQGSAFNRSVLFRLHFVEVKRSLLENIGVNWQKEAAGPTLGLIGVARNTGVYNPIPAGTGTNNLLAPDPEFITRSGKTGGVFFGLATTLASRINLGINNGDARVLASPELTARSGGKASLQVGGEVPIPLAGALGTQTVEFKDYGILFNIEPQIDADDVISAKLSTEMSQIDPAVSVNGIPGFVTRNTATEISVKPGEMVALSGLVNSDLANSIDRVPGLSKIPILGRLFRSDDFRNQRSELVVFLESEIVTAGQGMANELRNRGVAAKEEFEQRVRDAGQQPEVLPNRQAPVLGTPPAAGD